MGNTKFNGVWIPAEIWTDIDLSIDDKFFYGFLSRYQVLTKNEIFTIAKTDFNMSRKRVEKCMKNLNKMIMEYCTFNPDPSKKKIYGYGIAKEVNYSEL